MFIKIKFYFFVLLAASMSVSISAKNNAYQKTYKEIERQLKSLEQDKRYDDIKLIQSHKKSLQKQVRSGDIDLQAIIDEHNYKHKDGKYYGQTMPKRESNKTLKNQKPKDSTYEPINATVKYDEVPASNKPIDAYTYLKTYWTGFPAIAINKVKISYKFPNGYYVHCANWDPRVFDPEPNSVGQGVKKCDVDRNKPPKSAKAKAFKKGQRIDIDFGKVGGNSIDMGSSSSSTITGGTLIMDKTGRIAIGKFNSFSVSSGGNGAGGRGRTKKLIGKYSLDGHLITITSNDGQVDTGFISWTSNKGSKKIDHVYINGEHFWNRKKNK